MLNKTLTKHVIRCTSTIYYTTQQPCHNIDLYKDQNVLVKLSEINSIVIYTYV